MPELPEVETTKRGIENHLVGKKINRVVIRESRFRWPINRGFRQKVDGHIVRAISRRAKYILFQFDHGYFMIHLGMSGNLRIVNANTAIKKHDHVDFQLATGKCLRFNDPRRFGSVLWLGSSPFEHPLLSKLGPEPFDQSFNGEYLFQRARKKKIAVKNFIMNNHIVVGAGNIYANEALFISGIRPTRPAGKVTKAESQALVEAIIMVLKSSIEMGGTTLKDFVGGDGKPGYFQQTLRVYDREQQPCRKCNTPIKALRIGQRSSYYCPHCQK